MKILPNYQVSQSPNVQLQMQFKITILTGVFSLLISSFSIGKPISQKEIPTYKIEQTTKKKQFPLFRGITKMVRDIRNTRGQKASAWSITSMSLGIAALPLYVTVVWGFVASGLAAIIGIIGLVRAKNGRSALFSKYGIKLGAGLILGVLLFVFLVKSLGSIQ